MWIENLSVGGGGERVFRARCLPPPRRLVATAAAAGVSLGSVFTGSTELEVSQQQHARPRLNRPQELARLVPAGRRLGMGADPVSRCVAVSGTPALFAPRESASCDERQSGIDQSEVFTAPAYAPNRQRRCRRRRLLTAADAPPLPLPPPAKKKTTTTTPTTTGRSTRPCAASRGRTACRCRPGRRRDRCSSPRCRRRRRRQQRPRRRRRPSRGRTSSSTSSNSSSRPRADDRTRLGRVGRRRRRHQGPKTSAAVCPTTTAARSTTTRTAAPRRRRRRRRRRPRRRPRCCSGRSQTAAGPGGRPPRGEPRPHIRLAPPAAAMTRARRGRTTGARRDFVSSLCFPAFVGRPRWDADGPTPADADAAAADTLSPKRARFQNPYENHTIIPGPPASARLASSLSLSRFPLVRSFGDAEKELPKKRTPNSPKIC